MAEYATQKGLGCWLETNGTLVTRDLAFHLKEKTSIFSVSVSIDGETEETHDFMRNMVGSHKQAQRGVSNLVEAGYKVQIIMSLFEGNVEEIEPLVRWAVQSGCGSVKFNIIQPSGRALQMRRKDNLLTIEKLVQLGSWVEKELQPSVSIPLYYSWPMAFQGFKQLRHSLQGASCDIHSILGVLSTGHLSMCGIGVQESDLVYGQLGVDQVKEIWTTNPVLSNLREAVPTKLEGVCGQCFFKNRCVGSCIAQNYFTTKKLTAPFWFCHDAIENDLFPKSRLQQLDESLPAEISKITGE
jgi:SynChlorMet cassette radical SAM/SPASM protein ScmF